MPTPHTPPTLIALIRMLCLYTQTLSERETNPPASTFLNSHTRTDHAAAKYGSARNCCRILTYQYDEHSTHRVRAMYKSTVEWTRDMPQSCAIDLPANAQLRRNELQAQLDVAEEKATTVGDEWTRAREELELVNVEIVAMAPHLALNPALSAELVVLSARRITHAAMLEVAEGKRREAQQETAQIRIKLLALDDEDDGMGIYQLACVWSLVCTCDCVCVICE